MFAYRKGHFQDKDEGSGTKKRKRTGPSKKGTKRVKKADRCQPDLGEDDESLFKSLWSRAATIFEGLQREAFTGILEAIVEFTRRASKRSEKWETSSATIPTCTLLTGVNLPDHEDLFK